jgi:hypothetical protein
MIKKEQQEGRILGIKLPRLKKRQLIAQYADDTNFTIKTSHDATQKLAQVLEEFSHAFGLELNNAKTMAFWIGNKKETRPGWTKEFNWTCASPDLHGIKVVGDPFWIVNKLC